MIINFLITGNPGTGKTTLIKKAISDIDHPVGFYTEEIRKNGKRCGFITNTLSTCNSQQLAHTDISSEHTLGKYKINVQNFEKLIKKEFENYTKAELLVIDEIGKMEIFSKYFREKIIELLNSPIPLIGIIQKTNYPFIKNLTSRNDITIVELKRNNSENLFQKITSWINSVT
ncbi:MAG: nucleoside-triphosphatase [Elusimicrobiota bacterium]